MQCTSAAPRVQEVTRNALAGLSRRQSVARGRHPADPDHEEVAVSKRDDPHMKTALIVSLAWSIATGLCLSQTKPCRPGRHARLPAVTELTYSRARKKLLTAGWQPFQTKSFNEAAADPDIQSGNGPLFWKRGYVELEACSGTGVAACAFLFRDAYGNYLRVTTAGEGLPKEKAYARVTGFQFVCDYDKEQARSRHRSLSHNAKTAFGDTI